MYGYVFFATARGTNGPWRARQISRFIRFLTNNRMAHCMIGFDGAVLDPTMRGNDYYTLTDVVERYPTLAAVFKIPFQYKIDLDFFQYHVGIKKQKLPTFFRWLKLTLGLQRDLTEDCLCVTIACLKAGGVNIPLNIASPVELYRWLRRNKYDCVTDKDTGKRRFRHSVRQYIFGEETSRDVSSPDL